MRATHILKTSVLLVGLFTALDTRAVGSTLTFTGQLSSDWNVAGNWSDGAIPTAGDDVVISFGRAPALTAGTAGSARLIRLDPGASLVVADRNLTITGGAPSSFGGQLYLTEATLRLGGPATWSGGTWSLSNATLESTGELLITGDVTARNLAGDSLIHNSGAITRDDDDPASGAATFRTRLFNDGSFTIVDGVAQIAGGEAASAGSFWIGAGGILSTDRSQSLAAGGAIAGPGTLRLDGGTLTVPLGAGTFDPATTLLSGGTLNLYPDTTLDLLTSDGEGGGRDGPARLFAGGPTLLDNVAIRGGTTTLTGPEVILRELGGGGGELVLGPMASTLWDRGNWLLTGVRLHNAGRLLVAGDGRASAARFLNTGTLTRDDADPATGSLTFTGSLENNGRLEVVDGLAVLAAGAEPSSGTFAIGAEAMLSATASQTLEGNGDVTGPGTLRLDGGVFTVPPGNGTFDPATLIFSGGSLELARDATLGRLTSDGQGGGRGGPATLTAGGPTLLDNVTLRAGTTNLTGSAITARRLTATGSALNLLAGSQTVWDGGTWSMTAAAVANAGELRITGDVDATSGGGTPRIHNTGTLIRDDADPATGMAQLSVGLRNSGLLRVVRGTLDAGADAQQDGGATAIDAGAVLGGPGSRYTSTQVAWRVRGRSRVRWRTARVRSLRTRSPSTAPTRRPRPGRSRPAWPARPTTAVSW